MMGQKLQGAPPAGGPEAATVLVTIQRDLNVLGDASAERGARLAALRAIERDAVERMPVLANDAERASVFLAVERVAVRALADPVEKCREAAAQVLARGCALLDADALFKALQRLVPVVAERLAGPEVAETSEERRLQLVTLLGGALARCGERGGAFADEAAAVASQALQDTFPEVRRAACELVVELSEAFPRPFHALAGPLAVALGDSLQHRHATLRCHALRAFCACVLADPEAAALEKRLPILHALARDRATAVRQELYTAAAAWLTVLPDRWGFAGHTLPLLLVGRTDPVASVQDAVVGHLAAVGALYELEWDDRVKDECDYGVAAHGGAVGGRPRPRPGLRRLARDHTLVMVTRIAEDLADWTEDTRLDALRVLYALLPCCETLISGYFGKLEPALLRLLADEPVRGSAAPPAEVAAQLQRSRTAPKPSSFDALMARRRQATGPAASPRESPAAAAVTIASVPSGAQLCALELGRYMETGTWTAVLLPKLRNDGTVPMMHLVGSLRLAERLASGSAADAVAQTGEAIVAQVHAGELLGADLRLTLLALQLVQAVVARASSLDAAVVSLVFDAAVAGAAAADAAATATGDVVADGDLAPACRDVISRIETALAERTGHATVAALYDAQFDAALTRLVSSPESVRQWTRSGPNAGRLEQLVVRTGAAAGSADRFARLKAVWRELGRAEADGEMRARALRCAGAHVVALNQSAGAVRAATADLLEYVVFPSLRWRAGRPAAAARAAAVALLHALAVGGLVEPSAARSVTTAEDWRRLAEELLEEDDVRVREQVVALLPALWAQPPALSTLKLFAHALIKRLDDAHDAVRLGACAALEALFEAVRGSEAAAAAFASARGAAVDEAATGVTIQAAAAVVKPDETDPGVEFFEGKDEAYLEVRLDAAQWEALVRGLVIHMDDPSDAIRGAVARVLQSLGDFPAARASLASELSSARSKHRHVAPIEDLLGHLAL